MKASIFRRLAAGVLSCALLCTTSLAAGQINWGDQQFFVEDEVFQTRLFQQGMESLLEQAMEENYTEAQFSQALNQLIQQVRDSGAIEEEQEHQISPEEMAQAQYDFDPATGTIRKVTVTKNAPMLDIPQTINGVTVRAIGPYAINGLSVVSILLPQTIEELDCVIVANCPQLKAIDYYTDLTKTTARIYENCPQLLSPAINPMTPYHEWESKPVYTKKNGTYVLSDTYLNLPQTLMTALEVFQGDGSGMQWDRQLTRAEAITLLIRLLGMEEEARAAASQPCPFPDVPDWAKGYVNLGYRLGMVAGVDDGSLFGPSRLCDGQQLCTMLLRLTDLKENTDFSWSTAIGDMRNLVDRSRALTGESDRLLDNTLFALLYNSPFTRELACALLYRALSVPVDGGVTSLGDKLCAEYGLSTSLLARYNVRLTPAALNSRVADSVGENQNLLYALLVMMDDEAKDQAVEAARPEIPQEVAAMAQSIITGLTSDYDKAQAICFWVANHIAYDYDTYEGRADDPQDALSVLRNRRAICGGYAQLTKAMLWAVDIPALYVLNGTSGSAVHAWNEIYVDGRWLPVDNTWSSRLQYRNGAVTGETVDSLYYFDNAYEDFYNGHSLSTLWIVPITSRYFY